MNSVKKSDRLAPFLRLFAANLPGSAFRVFRVFRGHSAVRDERRSAQMSVPKPSFRFCDFSCFLRPILRTVFTTDYADSADISLIAEHPCSSVTSVVKNADTDLRLLAIFSLTDLDQLDERTTDIRV